MNRLYRVSNTTRGQWYVARDADDALALAIEDGMVRNPAKARVVDQHDHYAAYPEMNLETILPYRGSAAIHLPVNSADRVLTFLGTGAKSLALPGQWALIDRDGNRHGGLEGWANDPHRATTG